MPKSIQIAFDITAGDFAQNVEWLGTDHGVDDLGKFRFNIVTSTNSVVNRIESVLLHWSVVSDGTKSVIYRIYKNATIVAGTFADHESGISVMEVNTTNTITDGSVHLGTTTSKEDSKDLDIEHLRMDLHKTNSYTITAESANASDVSTILTWREDF